MIKNLSLVMLIVFSFNVDAWWDKAHSMVCDEAYKLLSAPTKKFLDPSLKNMDHLALHAFGLIGLKMMTEKIQGLGTTLIFLIQNKIHTKLHVQKMDA